jgi:hypothetical protein
MNVKKLLLTAAGFAFGCVGNSFFEEFGDLLQAQEEFFGSNRANEYFIVRWLKAPSFRAVQILARPLAYCIGNSKDGSFVFLSLTPSGSVHFILPS